jgi:hypothetical protein
MLKSIYKIKLKIKINKNTFFSAIVYLVFLSIAFQTIP